MRTKEEFLRRFGADYGYPDSPRSIDEIRATEFKRLGGLVYLDHAGATLYSEAQMEAVAKDLTSNVYGNPLSKDSQSDSSMATSDIVSAARQQVLDYFNASPKEYRCIFTSGATAALKLVGECFPWRKESCYMYTLENHNSVLGIREYALEHGATALAVDVEDVKSHDAQKESAFLFSEHSEQRRAETKFSKDGLSSEVSGSTYNLFAFPSECNFSGKKFSPDLVNAVKKDTGKCLNNWRISRDSWLVLIDAAKGCTTEPPDLTKFPADFVVFSFYKIFGYPTGLGALVVRSDAARILRKTYFSGGTVSASIADVDFVKRRDSIEQIYEDGTLSFLAIVSIHHGFKIINALTVSAIARHTRSIAEHVRSVMKDLKHENGMKFCRIYGTDILQVPSDGLGPTISFNLRRSDGSWIGYREVEKLASLSGIQLRTGCFCNPGACAKYLGLSHSVLIANFEAGHVCWDDNDILDGNTTGAVRISFGYMSTYEDAERFLNFLGTSFMVNSVGKYSPTRNSAGNALELLGKEIRLKLIMLYPVKSCAGFTVKSWPLSSTGLKYDREWLLQGPTGEILTQKKVPKMRCISTFIDLENAMLHLQSPFCKDRLEFSILQHSSHELSESIDVYGQSYKVQAYDHHVNLWFSEAIGRLCTLVRCSTSENPPSTEKVCIRGMCRDTWSKLNFVNEAQLLLVSEESVSDLNDRLSSTGSAADSFGCEKPLKVDAARFRPNLVISGSEPFAEDGWRNIHIGKAKFTSLGGCSRCQMINLDQHSGLMQKANEPLATLSSYRRAKGKILFGILLKYDIGAPEDEKRSETEQWLHVGQEVYPVLRLQ